MKDRLQAIFDKKAEFLRSLAPIYDANHFEIMNQWPYAINGRHAQEQFRLLAWRITEEVYEALEEWDKGPGLDIAKYREEVADVLHFFVELAIICGITWTEVATGGDAGLLSDQDYLEISFDRVQYFPNRMTGREAWGMFLTTIAKLMMEFRQRPWRTDDRPSDFSKIKFGFGCAWLAFCAACVATEMQTLSLEKHYYAKGIINEERLQANLPQADFASIEQRIADSLLK